ncbi:MAG: hypothetical protein ACI82A_000156 [Candidatus Azotimanducaceae bacterium]|jgi:hypothetical protein
MDNTKFNQLDRPIVNETGKIRRVGFELEFSGLEMATVARILADTLSGTYKPLNQAECKVETKQLGTFKVELDWQLGKILARQRKDERDTDEDDPLMSWLTSTASEIVPIEIVCPPIAADNLAALNPLIEALREAGAMGTSASPIYAFGVHINPELPDTKPVTIANYLKAFCLAQEWLVAEHKVDLSRRITPYINLFPAGYVAVVLDYDGQTTLDELIDDYVEHNPTRNRALDMTPLFRHLNEERLTRAIDDEKINARPTFHYRLPNCHVGREGWYLNQCWNLWCVIERLSLDEQRLVAMTSQWQARHDQIIPLQGYTWHSELNEVQADLLSA